jgi:hypothetical protein
VKKEVAIKKLELSIPIMLGIQAKWKDELWKPVKKLRPE